MGFLFGFRGRFSRVEWWSVAFLAVAAILSGIAVVARGHGWTLPVLIDRVSAGEWAAFAPEWLAAAAVLMAAGVWMLSVATIKRLHDVGKSGWWALTILVPVVGLVWQIIECGFIAGEDGPNAHDAVARERIMNAAGPAVPVPQGPPAHRLERAIMFSAAKQAHIARTGRRSYQA